MVTKEQLPCADNLIEANDGFITMKNVQSMLIQVNLVNHSNPQFGSPTNL